MTEEQLVRTKRWAKRLTTLGVILTVGGMWGMAVTDSGGGEFAAWFFTALPPLAFGLFLWFIYMEESES